MNPKNSAEKILIPFEEMFAIGVAALELVEVPKKDAETTTDVLLCADMRGIHSHGIQRLTFYIPRLKKRLINPQPKIEVKSTAEAVKIVYGDDGLGPVVATRGMKEAIQQAKASGIAFIGCRDSNHFGAATPYVLMACKEKMIGIASSNAYPTMAPWGALDKLVGANPLAIGVPYEQNSPFLLDIAMSTSSRGRMRLMAERKQKMPKGWAVDSRGKSTTDPLAGLKGFVLPIGGHKGYGLAVAIDILCGVLTGAEFSTGVKSLIQQWEEPQHIGHIMIAIDPRRFMSLEMFSHRMKQLCSTLREAKRIDPQTPIFVPGEPEAKIENVSKTEGIPFDQMTFEILKGLSQGQYDYEIPRF